MHSGWGAGQLIDGFLQKSSRIRIANEQPTVLDPDIFVENTLSCGVRVNHKSMTVEGDSGQAHRIERSDPRAPETEAISIRR
jgi:hypothetical protein